MESSPSQQPLPELPWAFIDCPSDDLVVLIAHMLNRLIEHNDQVVLTPSTLTRFHSRAPPQISVIDYLRRIVKYTNLEKLPLLSLLAYIDITCTSLPTFTLSSLTVHRFLIAGVTAGSKALCDVFCTNGHYAKVGGIKVGELNALEREFVKVTEWNLCVHAELLQQYYTSLIRSHGGYTQLPQPETSPFTSFPLEPPAPSPRARSRSALVRTKSGVDEKDVGMKEVEKDVRMQEVNAETNVEDEVKKTVELTPAGTSSAIPTSSGAPMQSTEQSKEDDDIIMQDPQSSAEVTTATSPAFLATASSSSCDSSSLSDRSHTLAPTRNKSSTRLRLSSGTGSGTPITIFATPPSAGGVASPRVSPAEASGSGSRKEIGMSETAATMELPQGLQNVQKTMNAALGKPILSEGGRKTRQKLPTAGSASHVASSGSGHGHGIKGFVGGLLKSRNWAEGKMRGKTPESTTPVEDATVASGTAQIVNGDPPVGSVTPKVRTREDRSPSPERLDEHGQRRRPRNDTGNVREGGDGGEDGTGSLGQGLGVG